MGNAMYNWAVDQCNDFVKTVAKDEQEYMRMCCDSALKAYKCLIEDAHSGMSIGFTKNILMDLIDGRPLVAIQNEPDDWVYKFSRGNKLFFAHKKYNSLSKKMDVNGNVLSYTDTHRLECVNVDNGVHYYNGFLNNVLHDLFPIQFPYAPPKKPFKMIVKNILANPDHGDFDAMKIMSIVTPDGHVRIFEMCYAEIGNEWKRISSEEWQTLEKRAREIREYYTPPYGKEV